VLEKIMEHFHENGLKGPGLLSFAHFVGWRPFSTAVVKSNKVIAHLYEILLAK
jgi:hypothetical protein